MLQLDELWTHITGRVEQIKSLPDNIVIHINDDDREYGRINKDNINYDNDTVWVQLNHNTRLTLFVKDDYKAVAKKARLGGLQLAQSEIAHTFEFSKPLEIESVFQDWQEII